MPALRRMHPLKSGTAFAIFVLMGERVMISFSKCEWSRLQRPLFFVIFTCASFAFFAPAAFCEIYAAFCAEFEILQHFDKVFHAMFFAGVAFFVPLARPIGFKILIFVGLILLGLGIEIIQYYTPNRGASLHDLLANTVGVFIGFALRACKHIYHLT